MIIPSPPIPFPFPGSGGIEVEPLYAALRELQPVVRIAMPYGAHAWLATRYEDVRAVLSDPRFSRAAAADGDMPRINKAPTFGGSVMDLDPPEHTRLRRVIYKAFTNRRMDQLRPRIQRITDDLIDSIERQPQPVDLVPALAQQVPLSVMCMTLGVPFADRDQFLNWSSTVLATTDATAEQIEQARQDMRCYLASLVDSRRCEPGDDLLSALIYAHDVDGKLSHDEMVELASTLLVGGHATTIAHIAKSIYTLLAKPQHWHTLTTEPGVLPTAVEELLRYVPLGVGSGNPRIALADVELGGVLIKAGDIVVVARHSANHDETMFDHAGELDLWRSPNPHLGFGHGLHFCAGAKLARMELQIVLGTLAVRLPNLRLATGPADVPWATGVRAWRPLSLLARW
jgi:cytochrome P450